MTEQELQEIENTTGRIRDDVDDWRGDFASVRLAEVRATCDALKTLIAEVRRLRGSPNYVVSFSCGTCVRMDCLDCNLKKLNDYKEASNG